MNDAQSIGSQEEDFVVCKFLCNPILEFSSSFPIFSKASGDDDDCFHSLVYTFVNDPFYSHGRCHDHDEINVGWDTQNTLEAWLSKDLFVFGINRIQLSRE